MNLRNAIDNSPMGGTQWSIVILATIINALDGYDILAMAFTANPVQKEFGLNGSQLGMLLSSGLVGMALGALIFGPVADKIGRRNVLLLSLVLNIAGLALSATAGSAIVLALWRVVTGLGIGGILACITVLVSEFSNNKHRGMAISIYAAGYGLGATFGGMGAGKLIPSMGWHSVFVAGAILSAIALVATFFILPESPDFLYQKQPANAQEQLRSIARRIGKQDTVTDYELPAAHSLPRVHIKDLLATQMRSTSLKIWAAFFIIMFGFYFASSWTPKLLVEVGMSERQGIWGGIALTFGGTIGALLYGLLSTKFDNLRLLMTFIVLSAITLVVFIYATSLPTVALLAAVLVGMLMNGCISGMYTITPTSYPSHLRTSGMGTGLGIGRAGAILAPTVVGALLDAGWTPQHLYTAVAVVVFLGTFVLIGLKPYLGDDSAAADDAASSPEPQPA